MVRLGVWVKFRVSFRVGGATRQFASRKIVPWLGFGLGFVLGLWTIFLQDNCPRTMEDYTWNLPVCNSGEYIYFTGLCNFFFVLQNLIDRINSYFQRIAFQRNLLLTGF